MPNVDFSVSGFDSVLSRVADLGSKGARIENDALREGAKPVFDAMVKNAPVRTGKGRDSIRIGKIKSGQSGKNISIGIHKEQHDTGLHMYYVEFGTSRAPEHPFIRPAYEATKSEAMDTIRAEIRKALQL